MLNKLEHQDFRPDGIFGKFTFEGDDAPFMDTLEHAYQQDDGSYLPKLYPGTFRCVRGVHALHNGVHFEAFEITGVEGHAGMLFHPGCFNRDSEGCVLCGKGELVQEDGEEMLTSSRIEFAAFMKRLEGIDEFDLIVT